MKEGGNEGRREGGKEGRKANKIASLQSLSPQAECELMRWRNATQSGRD